MRPEYAVNHPDRLTSPALLFFRRVILHNRDALIALAGDARRLRPHVKTHKTREIVRLQLEAGITRHKCATIAEAELLASAGAPDVLFAYPPVGPNIVRLSRLIAKYPATEFSTTVDHPASARALSGVLAASGQTIEVLLDLDVGMHRTGIACGPAAAELYELIAALPGLRPGGFHAYDGHNNQPDPAERAAGVQAVREELVSFRESVERRGIPVPRVVAGGTPSFPVWARTDLPGLECSPGTLALHDHGYGSRYPDLAAFRPAALLLTRVISRPTPNRVTFDVGYKAVAGDPPAGKRLVFPDIAAYDPVVHSEEHFSLDTPDADRFSPGDVAYAVPTHICPTCALHRDAVVIDDGEVVGRWPISARDRVLDV